MRSFLLFSLLVASTEATACPKGWFGFIPTSSCYLFAKRENVTQPQAEQKCISQGCHLTSINTEEELQFISKTAKDFYRSTYTFSEQPWIGMKRQGKSENWYWEDRTKGRGVQWAKGEPNNLRGIENCVKVNILHVIDPITWQEFLFKGDMNTINDTPCDRISSRFICRQKVAEKCDVNAQNTTSGCVCDTGFIDIRNTSLPDGKLYRKSGMNCIAIDPCGTVSQPQTIIFIMDSSFSVTATGWANLLSFMEKAAPLVPKNSRVGFIKFSDNVTAKLWVKDNWTEQDFVDSIPKKFDNEPTQPHLAIHAAAEMLKDDPNQKRTVVLLTDGNRSTFSSGMPGALDELKKAQGKLLAVGFGHDLEKYGRTAIESWLDNPSEDYFAYHEDTSLLTEDHMKGILTKVCQK